MWQNSCWMIGTAWGIKEKKVVFLCLVQVMIALGQNLISLFISPAVISAVETQKPLSYLLITISGCMWSSSNRCLPVMLRSRRN